MGKGRLLHSATARPLPPPPSQGCALGRGSAPPFAYKHLLSADFMPEFSNPQGAATKALPTCKITTGSSGPQEANGQDPNSFWQSHIEGWRLTPAGESVSLLQSLPRGRATLALPHIPRVGRKRRVVTFFSLSVTYFTSPWSQTASGPSSAPPPTSEDVPLSSIFGGTPRGPEDKGQALPSTRSPVGSLPGLPHTCSSFLPGRTADCSSHSPTLTPYYMRYPTITSQRSPHCPPGS